VQQHGLRAAPQASAAAAPESLDQAAASAAAGEAERAELVAGDVRVREGRTGERMAGYG